MLGYRVIIFILYSWIGTHIGGYLFGILMGFALDEKFDVANIGLAAMFAPIAGLLPASLVGIIAAITAPDVRSSFLFVTGVTAATYLAMNIGQIEFPGALYRVGIDEGSAFYVFVSAILASLICWMISIPIQRTMKKRTLKDRMH